MFCFRPVSFTLVVVMVATSVSSFTPSPAEAGCYRQCIGNRCRICCTREPSYAAPPPYYIRRAPPGFDPGPRSYSYTPPSYDYAAEQRRQEEEARQDRLRREQEWQREQEEARQQQLREQQERWRQERAEAAQRMAQYQAEQRELERQRQAERDAEWERTKQQVLDTIAQFSATAGAWVYTCLEWTLWIGLPFALVVALLWATSIWIHRYYLWRVNRNIDLARTSKRRFDELADNLRRANDEATAFIEQEAELAYRRGRGL